MPMPLVFDILEQELEEERLRWISWSLWNACSHERCPAHEAGWPHCLKWLAGRGAGFTITAGMILRL
jgi:hypothetical protein